MIVQPRGVPQSYFRLKWQILHFFGTLGPFLWVPEKRREGIVLLLRAIPEISGRTRNFGFTRNIGQYPLFRVTRYPMISKTELGRVGYQKKYRVAGWVRVPAGHCSGRTNILQSHFTSASKLLSYSFRVT